MGANATQRALRVEAMASPIGRYRDWLLVARYGETPTLEAVVHRLRCCGRSPDTLDITRSGDRSMRPNSYRVRLIGPGAFG